MYNELQGLDVNKVSSKHFIGHSVFFSWATNVSTQGYGTSCSEFKT